MAAERKGGTYSQIRFTKLFSDLFKDVTKSASFFPRGTGDRCSEPHLADRFFGIVFRSGGGTGVIVGYLFE